MRRWMKVFAIVVAVFAVLSIAAPGYSWVQHRPYYHHYYGGGGWGPGYGYYHSYRPYYAYYGPWYGYPLFPLGISFNIR